MSSETMKAVRLHKFGGPEVLRYEDAPKPALAADELLIRVKAVGVNPPDWYLRDGYRTLPPEWQPAGDFPIIPGTDVAGVVETVGADVEGFAPGDEVYSMVRFPEGVFGGSKAYAQYVTAPAAHVGHKPLNIDFVHAAAAPMSLLTAWQFLVDLGHDQPNPVMPEQHRHVPLAGQRVLINGAGGGVGHLALQIAQWKGADVVAVGSGRHEPLLRDLGASEFHDYTKVNVEDTLRDFDLVIDAVGGPSTARFASVLRDGGALFPIFPLGYESTDAIERRGIVVSATQVRSNGRQLDEIAPLLDDGTIRVLIDSRFPLVDAAGAHRRAQTGNISGKIVLEVA